jgi:hypothetical protein
MRRPRSNTEFPVPVLRGSGDTAPFSQAEDSTQTSGSEPRMPDTSRPRVRNRDHRPGFHL